MRHTRRRPSSGRATVLAAAAAFVVLATGSGRTLAGWTTGTIFDDTDTGRVGALAITHTYGPSSCSSSARMTSVACSPGLGTTASPTATVTDSITNSGSVAVTQSVSAVSCAPVQFANSASSADPMLPRNAVAFEQSDRWGTTSAAAFSGTGYATDAVGTTGSGVLGLLQSSFSIGVWFKAADTQGGGLISLSSSLSNGSGAANPAIWLDGAGNVYGHVSTTLAGTDVHSSGVNYADGSWHFAALVTSTPLLATGVTLYVDGVNVASAGGLSLLTSTTGYWHLGWASISGLAAPYFHGSLSGAFVQQRALASSAVSTLYGAASASAYQSALAGLSPVSTWMLGDDGVATVPGTTVLPTTLSDPCGKVDVTLTSSNPSASVPRQSWDSLVTGGAVAVAAPAVGGTQTLTVTTNQGSGYSSDLAGIHLYVPLSFTYAVPGSASWTATFTWSGVPTQVFWA